MITDWEIDTNIFEHLREEHREIKSLMELGETIGVRNRNYIMKKIEINLVPHARAEEQVLYSMVRRRSRNRSKPEVYRLAEKAFEENRKIDNLLNNLMNQSIFSEDWLVLLKALRQTFELHIREEELRLFPEVKNLFNSAEREILLEDYIDAKQNYIVTLPTQAQVHQYIHPSPERKPDKGSTPFERAYGQI